MLGNAGPAELLVVLLVAGVAGALFVWPATRICAKAGYSPWLGFVIIIPVANLFLLWFLALADWPSRKAGR